jgi:hypothetical protein
VFEMFTPEGERAWAPGWDPRPVFPEGATSVRDAVFTIDHGGAHAVWLVVELDRERGTVGYVNFVAGERVVRVEVACRADGPSATDVTVRYVGTGLSHAGNEHLRRFDANFDHMMRSWQESIGAALDAGYGPVGR